MTRTGCVVRIVLGGLLAAAALFSSACASREGICRGLYEGAASTRREDDRSKDGRPPEPGPTYAEYEKFRRSRPNP